MRLHGDEFAIWLGRITSTARAEGRALQIADALAEPLQIGGRRLVVPGSVGVAVAPARTPLGELLNTADQHMYQVKATHHLPALPAGEPRRARDRATPPDHAA
ncbi:diguanylate cyclase domain-containing protein [Saccharopolyspora spinosporotrichia]